MLQALCSQPRLHFQSIILALGADLQGSTLCQDSAALAFSGIMFGFAWSIEMVRVYVKDQVGSLPSLFVHGRCWLLVVCCGEVDVDGDKVADCCEKQARFSESSVSDHEFFFEEENAVFSLLGAGRQVEALVMREIVLLEFLPD